MNPHRIATRCNAHGLPITAAGVADVLRYAAEEAWQPISDAPRDGTWFDVWIATDTGGYRIADVRFSPSGKLEGTINGYVDLARWPTHWQPLPPPPSADLSPPVATVSRAGRAPTAGVVEPRSDASGFYPKVDGNPAVSTGAGGVAPYPAGVAPREPVPGVYGPHSGVSA